MKCVFICKDSFSQSRNCTAVVLLIHWWAWEIPFIHCAEAMEVDENTGCVVYQLSVKEVCSTQLLG